MQKTEYQIHLHMVPNDTYGVAHFDDPAEAAVYFTSLITDLLALPQIADADWLSDEHVHLLGQDGSIIAHATIVFETITLH